MSGKAPSILCTNCRHIPDPILPGHCGVEMYVDARRFPNRVDSQRQIQIHPVLPDYSLGSSVRISGLHAPQFVGQTMMEQQGPIRMPSSTCHHLRYNTPQNAAIKVK